VKLAFNYFYIDLLLIIDHVTVSTPTIDRHALTSGASSKTFNNNDNNRKTWVECVMKDLVELSLHREWALDRVGGGVLYAETGQRVQAWTMYVKRR